MNINSFSEKDLKELMTKIKFKNNSELKRNPENQLIIRTFLNEDSQKYNLTQMLFDSEGKLIKFQAENLTKDFGKETELLALISEKLKHSEVFKEFFMYLISELSEFKRNPYFNLLNFYFDPKKICIEINGVIEIFVFSDLRVKSCYQSQEFTEFNEAETLDLFEKQNFIASVQSIIVFCLDTHKRIMEYLKQ